MITFTKRVNELICFKDIDGVQDLVHTVVWTFIATDEDGTSESYGMRCDVPNLSSSDFKPFDALTEQTIDSWIEIYTPPQRMQAAKQYLQDMINYRKTQIPRRPPWYTGYNAAGTDYTTETPATS